MFEFRSKPVYRDPGDVAVEELKSVLQEKSKIFDRESQGIDSDRESGGAGGRDAVLLAEKERMDRDPDATRQ